MRTRLFAALVGAGMVLGEAAAQPPREPLPTPRELVPPPRVNGSSGPTPPAPTVGGPMVGAPVYMDPWGSPMPWAPMPGCFDGYPMIIEEHEVVTWPRGWFTAEALLLWPKAAPLPVPVVTTGSVTDLGPGGRPGTLGSPTTSVVLGGVPIEFGPHFGGRFSAGRYMGPDQAFILEGVYSVLLEQSWGRQVTQPGTPGSFPLSVPFFDVTTGTENSTGIAFPRDTDPFGGGAELVLATRFQSGELNGGFRVVNRCNLRVDGLIGFRYVGLDEGLRFSTFSQNVPPAPADVFQTLDTFETDNDFYGGQVGTKVAYTAKSGKWYVEATGKVAMGVMHQTTTIVGTTVTNDFTDLTTLQTFTGGYLALPSNVGEHHRGQLGVVPEGILRFGWRPYERLVLTAGYSLLYLNSVARPGDQIDRVINPTQAVAYFSDTDQTLVGVPRPTFLGKTSDYWLHGITFGAEWRY